MTPAGPLAKNGPRYLRCALIEAAIHAHPLYEQTKQRLGRQRGPEVVHVVVARKLTEAIWPPRQTEDAREA